MKPKDMSYCKQIDEKQFPNNSVISTLNNSHRPTTNNTHRKYDQTPNQITFVNSELFDSHIFQEKKNKKNQRRDVMNKSLPAWGVSSSTLRHNSAKYSFSKDSRFKNQKCSHLDIQHLTLSSTLKNKSCTFGKGRRTPISQIVLNNAKFKPSPDRYDLTMYNETTRNKNLGKTFGIPWSDYQKIYITHRKDAYSHHFTKDNAEAIYEVRQIPGKHKRKFSMYKRLKMFNQYQADLHRMVPGPVHVVKDDFQKIKKGLNERNFGFGQRIDLAKPANDYPSPAAYNLKGFCSGFKIK